MNSEIFKYALRAFLSAITAFVCIVISTKFGTSMFILIPTIIVWFTAMGCLGQNLAMVQNEIEAKALTQKRVKAKIEKHSHMETHFHG